MQELKNIKQAFDIFIKKSDNFIKKQKEKVIFTHYHQTNNKKNNKK